MRSSGLIKLPNITVKTLKIVVIKVFMLLDPIPKLLKVKPTY